MATKRNRERRKVRKAKHLAAQARMHTDRSDDKKTESPRIALFVEEKDPSSPHLKTSPDLLRNLYDFPSDEFVASAEQLTLFGPNTPGLPPCPLSVYYNTHADRAGLCQPRQPDYLVIPDFRGHFAEVTDLPVYIDQGATALYDAYAYEGTEREFEDNSHLRRRYNTSETGPGILIQEPGADQAIFAPPERYPDVFHLTGEQKGAWHVAFLHGRPEYPTPFVVLEKDIPKTTIDPLTGFELREVFEKGHIFLRDGELIEPGHFKEFYTVLKPPAQG